MNRYDEENSPPPSNASHDGLRHSHLPEEAALTRSNTESNNTKLVHFVDDWTLESPSTTFRFRGKQITVHELHNSQMQFEQQIVQEEGEGDVLDTNRIPNDSDNNEGRNPQIIVRNVYLDRMLGLNLLRATYTLVCFFFAGILFILLFNTMLFLFMDVAAELTVRDSSRGQAAFVFLVNILAIPNLIIGFSTIMAIAGTMVWDAWSGHLFLQKLMVGWESVFGTEWIAFGMLLGIPLFSLIIMLFIGRDDWWEETVVIWFYCIALYFILFAAAVTIFDIRTAISILRQEEEENEEDSSTSNSDHDNSTRPQTTWSKLCRRAILRRQYFQLSGIASVLRIQNDNSMEEDTRSEQVPKPNLYARLTLTKYFSCMFDTLEEPQRIYTVQEILGTRQFVTQNSWSLEKVFCSDHRSRSVISVIQGKGSLNRMQMQCSFVFSIIGGLFVVLAFAAAAIYYDLTAVFALLSILLFLFCFIPQVLAVMVVSKTYRKTYAPQSSQTDRSDESNDGNEDNIDRTNESARDRSLFQIYERYRVSKPKAALSWTLFVGEVLFLWLWPFVNLLAFENWPIAGMFGFIGTIAMIQKYLNPSNLLKEDAKSLDQFSSLDRGHNSSLCASAGDRQMHWKDKSQLSTTLSSIVSGPRRKMWNIIFILISIFIILFSMGAVRTTSEDNMSDSDVITLLPTNNFAYGPSRDASSTPLLPYPTCKLSAGLELPGTDGTTALLDYSFLSLLAYQPQMVVQGQLDTYFGQDAVTIREDIVEFYRRSENNEAFGVSYQFLEFTDDYGVVVVRGSTTPWEWLTNVQLWGATAMSQLFLAAMPFQELWLASIDEILESLSWIQNQELGSIALYRQTTDFVEALQTFTNYTSLRITGQSLGGGISIITGAQTRIPAIAFSGPNAMLSRKTFDPPVSKDDLNNYAFNVIPARDIVPRVDIPAESHQNIDCIGPQESLWACHSAVRTYCELLYTCETANLRPVLCECVTKYGYPIPTQTGGNQSFVDLCGSKRDNI